jgi:hypothetical protein
MAKVIPDAFTESPTRGFRESKVRARVGNGSFPTIYVVTAGIRKCLPPFLPIFSGFQANNDYANFLNIARRWHARTVALSGFLYAGGVNDDGSRTESVSNGLAGMQPSVGGTTFLRADYDLVVSNPPTDPDPTHTPPWWTWDPASTTLATYGDIGGRAVTETRSNPFDIPGCVSQLKARLLAENFNYLWANHLSRSIWFYEWNARAADGGSGDQTGTVDSHMLANLYTAMDSGRSGSPNGIDQRATDAGIVYDGHELNQFGNWSGAQYQIIDSGMAHSFGPGVSNDVYHGIVDNNCIGGSRVQIMPTMRIDYCCLEFWCTDENNRTPVVVRDQGSLAGGTIYELPMSLATGRA